MVFRPYSWHSCRRTLCTAPADFATPSTNRWNRYPMQWNRAAEDRCGATHHPVVGGCTRTTHRQPTCLLERSLLRNAVADELLKALRRQCNQVGTDDVKGLANHIQVKAVRATRSPSNFRELVDVVDARWQLLVLGKPGPIA